MPSTFANTSFVLKTVNLKSIKVYNNTDIKTVKHLYFLFVLTPAGFKERYFRKCFETYLLLNI